MGPSPQPYLAAVSANQVASVGNDAGTLEDALRVAPNPTTRKMQIHYAVSRAGRVRLEVLDVSGRVVATVADQFESPGRHIVAWEDASGRARLSPGLYFVRFVMPGQVTFKKVAVIP